MSDLCEVSLISKKFCHISTDLACMRSERSFVCAFVFVSMALAQVAKRQTWHTDGHVYCRCEARVFVLLKVLQGTMISVITSRMLNTVGERERSTAIS